MNSRRRGGEQAIDEEDEEYRGDDKYDIENRIEGTTAYAAPAKAGNS